MDGSPHQRMPPVEPTRADGHEPGVLSLLQGRQLQAHLSHRARHRLQVVPVADRRQEQGRLSSFGQRRHAALIGAAQARADGQRLVERLGARPLRWCQHRRHLEQRQRVPVGRGCDPGRHAGRHGRSGELQQAARRGGIEAGDMNGVEADEAGRRALFVSGRQDHEYALGLEAPRSEQQRRDGRLVEPVRVLHQRRDRRLLRRSREQTEHGGADSERVARNGGPQGQRAPERHCLWLGKDVQFAEERAHQVGETSEGQLGFRLRAARVQDRETRDPALGVAQKGRLADPGLAEEEQDVAASLAGSADKRVDTTALSAAAHQHTCSIGAKTRHLPDARQRTISLFSRIYGCFRNTVDPPPEHDR